MIPRAHVIGIGQPAAGDDGVGIAVIVRLRAEGDVEGVVYETVTEPSALVERLRTDVPVVIVDAVVGGGEIGEVLVLEPADIEKTVRPLSTHGISLLQAIELADALAPGGVTKSVRLVGIVIEAPSGGGSSLSPRVAEAVPRAAAAVHRLLRDTLN